MDQIPLRDTGKMYDEIAALYSGHQRTEIQKVSDYEITSEICNAIEAGGTPHEASNVEPAGAQHPDNNGTDETITASDQNFHKASQTEALPVIVDTHEVIEERGAAVD